MKKITKIGISAIGAAAVAGIGYLGKKAYDKKKKPVENAENNPNADNNSDNNTETPKE